MILALAATFLALCASGAERNYRSEWRNYHSSGKGSAATECPGKSRFQRTKATTCCSTGDILASSALCTAWASCEQHHPAAWRSPHQNSLQ